MLLLLHQKRTYLYTVWALPVSRTFRKFSLWLASQLLTVAQSLKCSIHCSQLVPPENESGIWTSLSTEAYITVTAHFIVPSFDSQACTLETKAFPERHTDLNIKEKIIESTDEFKVSNNVMSIVHDQAANMELCSRHLYDIILWACACCHGTF